MGRAGTPQDPMRDRTCARPYELRRNGERLRSAGAVQENGVCSEVDKRGHFVAATGGKPISTGEEK